MKRLFASLFLVGFMVLMPVKARAVSMDNFKLHGFFDLEYEKADGPGHPTAAVGDKKGSFDQYHFNLLMEFPVSDKLTVKGHIEYEHGPQLTGKGEMKIEWSYLEYLLSNSMKLRGGIVLTPFGIYNEIHDATPTYVSTRVPWGIYKADKLGGFAMFPKFSTGINLLGNYESEGDLSLNYVVYVANGENAPDTKNEAEKDANDNKAIGGKVMVSPMSGLTVGASYFTGKKGTTELDHSAWAGTVSYRMSPLSLRAEYASSELDDVTETGWYGEIAYRINVITPFVRYGTLDPDDDTDNDEWTELVYGINYEIEPNFIFKIENRQFGGEANNSKVSEDYNEIGASVTVAF